MASRANAQRIASEPPTGELHLPSLDDFQQTDDPGVGEPRIGRVAGLDYEVWAAATIDLNSSDDRIASQRLRLRQKGYRKVDGQPLVGGFPHAEVWVIPRDKYEENRARRAAKIRSLVDAGEMMDSALQTPQITRTRAGGGR